MEFPMKTTKECMKKMTVSNLLVMGCLSAILGMAGCQQEGTAEKTGKKIDQTAESAGQSIKETTEKAGEGIESAAESAGGYVSDSVITTRVKAAFLNDPMLKSSQIEVTTVDGVVTLSGTVDSEQSVDRAEELAERQENVKSVENELVVDEGASIYE